MAAQKGNSFILKVGNDDSPETFTTIGGARTNDFTLTNGEVEITNKDSNNFRELLDGGGVQSIAMSVDGVFVDGTPDENFRLDAFNNSIQNFELDFGNGDTLTGSFLITNYSRSGASNGEETFSAQLSSSGAFTWTTA